MVETATWSVIVIHTRDIRCVCITIHGSTRCGGLSCEQNEVFGQGCHENPRCGVSFEAEPDILMYTLASTLLNHELN